MNKTLLMFSGGLDSTYLAWKLLQAGENLVLYHLVLKNKLNRWEEEQEAQLKIIEQFKEEFGDRVEYVESTLDVRNIKQIYDSEYYTPIGAVYAHTHGIKKMVLGLIKEDNPYLRENYFETVDVISNSTTELILPLIKTSKEEVINNLPEKYKTFSCRFPQNGKPCGTCKTCQTIIKIINKRL